MNQFAIADVLVRASGRSFKTKLLRFPFFPLRCLFVRRMSLVFGADGKWGRCSFSQGSGHSERNW